MTENKFRSTTIYGKLKCIDSTDGKILSDVSLNRNLTVKRDIILGEEIYDSTGNNIVSTNGNIIFTYNKILYTIPLSKLSYLNLLTSDIQTQINSISSSSTGSTGSSPSLLSTNNTFTGTNTFTKNITAQRSIYLGEETYDSITGNVINTYGNITFTYNKILYTIPLSKLSYLNLLTSDIQTQINSISSSSSGGGSSSSLLSSNNIFTGHNFFNNYVSQNIGGFNTQYGSNSLINNTSGSRNSAFGYDALKSNTDGYYNCAMGDATLSANTSGHHNVAIGNTSQILNTIGIANTSIGTDSLTANITGTFNTCVGNSSGYSITGNFNTCLGHGANVLNNCSYSTAVGVYATCTENHQIKIGTSDEKVYIPGACYLGDISKDNFLYGSTNIVDLIVQSDCAIGGSSTNTLQVNSISTFQNNITFYRNLNNVSFTVFDYIKNLSSDAQTQLNSISTSVSNILTQNNTFLGLNHFTKKCVISNIYDLALSVFGDTELQNTYINGECIIGNTLSNTLSVNSASVFQNTVRFSRTLNDVSASTFNYIKNITSDVQTQLNNKASLTLSNVFTGINTFNNGLSVSNGDLTVYGGNILFNNFIGGISKTVFNYLSGATSNIQNQLNTLFSLTPPGTIIMNVSTSTALTGYLSCDGSEVSKTVYANLYNAIQDTYGIPSNPTNFKLPNFQGLFLRGCGSQVLNGQIYNGINIGPTLLDSIRYQSGIDFTTSLNTTRVEVQQSFGGGKSVIGSLSWTNISQIGSGNETAPIHSCVRYYIKH